MADDGLRERGNALEEEFFRKQSAELVQQLRSTRATDDARSQMMAASGIADPALVDRFLEHGVTPATFAALLLAPLAAVAWADGRIENSERTAVLQEAASSGMVMGSPEYALLQDWLTNKPPASLMAAWRGYAAEISTTLGPEELGKFREALVGRANAVATAAGGFAGRGKTSREERQILDTIDAALRRE